MIFIMGILVVLLWVFFIILVITDTYERQKKFEKSVLYHDRKGDTRKSIDETLRIIKEVRIIEKDRK